MSDFKLTTPVAFIIFNRPDTTARVFAEIAKAKPPKLLVVADGARTNKIGEAEKVAATRAIIQRVDWDCEVLTNFSEVNLGCKVRVSSGIDWVFEQVEEAIILEDDCLPDPTFFRFCQEMLERYRHDERIGMISGDNFQFGQTRGDASYYFSKYMHIWGWASWRRAWKSYDVDIKKLPEMIDGKLLQLKFPNQSERNYWRRIFHITYEGKIDTWDYQWFFSLLAENQLCVLPNINLISNIGFGADATHTQSASKYSVLKVFPLEFPITHPELITPNFIADEYTAEGMNFNISVARNLMSLVINQLNPNLVMQLKKYQSAMYFFLKSFRNER